MVYGVIALGCQVFRMDACGMSFHARLLELPCVMEAMKTRDNHNYVKIGHVSQMMCVTKGSQDLPEINTDEAFISPHGLSPPAWNARGRFRQ
jgi:transcription initiation factor TFIID subunit 7